MAGTTDGYADDELSPEEQRALQELGDSDRQLTNEENLGLISGDDDAGNAAGIAEAEARDAQLQQKPPVPAVDPAAAVPPADPNAPPAEPAPAADQPPADETLAAFMARHRAAGKTDEEIAGLIENRGKRASREGFQRRRGRTAEQIAADRTAIAGRKDAIKGRSTDFNAKLEADPDEAARLLHEDQVNRDLAAEEARERQLDQEEHNARVDDAVEFAAKYIPDLQSAFPEIQSFGQAIGYTPEEIDNIADGRDIVVLDLARIAGKLMENKLIDRRGNLLPQPKPANDTPVDPRLRAPAPPAGHSAPAVAPAASRSLDEQAAAAVNMTDEEFEKLPPAELARMMGGR